MNAQLALADSKRCVILSDNRIIYDAICDNMSFTDELRLDIYSLQTTLQIPKINLLIVDDGNISAENIPLYRMNTLINLTSQSFVPDEIQVSKPFKLNDLLDIIKHNISTQGLFCCINNKWIYNQKISKFSSQYEEILLTDKENEIFSALLLNKKFTLSKNEMKDHIWHYHKDAESKTIETHLYNLKKKLPTGLLEVRSSECILHVNQLV
ncbi:helix-turn-helix domain-containing protein [Rickettsiaceae bacterium]|nr:helix-turn-helix domain-containing protein [Rickettsiaceae bacterium]